MPSLVGLPGSWRIVGEEGDEGTFVALTGLTPGVESYKELVAWIKGSDWAGFEILDTDYTIQRMDNGLDIEYRYPYHLKLSTDAKSAAILESNLDTPRMMRDEQDTVCASCYAWGIPLKWRAPGGAYYMYCDRCCPTCIKCKREGPVIGNVRTGKVDAAGRLESVYLEECKNCTPLVSCTACEAHFLDTDLMKKVPYPDGSKNATLCARCVQKFVCPDCKTFTRLRKGGNRCQECFVKQFERIIQQEPKFALGSLPREGLYFPDLPQRPFRTISIETEMDGDKDALSSVLYSCGIIQRPQVENYQSLPDASAEWMCHLKHDGTATAGELISHLLDLNDRQHADGLTNTLRRLRGLEKMGLISYGSGCGGHIHIDAHNYDWHDVYRLFTIFGYVEDVIYRLAGAGSSFGHRSLDKGAYTANRVPVGSYSQPVQKGPFGSTENFKAALMGADRGKAINLHPYQQAIGNCRCVPGRHGKIKNCTCNLGKATIEWRIWNSTGNPRILHAWIAIMQAMHAYCDGEGEPQEEWIQQYPAFAYTGKKWVNNTDSHKEKAKQRLEWMLRELVFTPDERKSILYATQASEMGDLFSLRERAAILKMGTQDLPPKTPARNPVRRERNINIKPRTPDEIRAIKQAERDPFARRR